MKYYLLLCITLILFFSCASNSVENQNNLKEVQLNWEDEQFNWESKINYSNPDYFMHNGKLTNISDNNFKRVQEYINKKPQDKIDIIRGVYKYIMDRNNFRPYADGGTLIAKRTVNKIFSEKTLTGCHDWAIVLVSILRKYNIPAIFVDTVLIGWANNYILNIPGPYEGHTFVEIFVEGKWILLNSTNMEVITEYDSFNPLLSFKRNETNYFVMFKGLDPWDYGIYSNEDMQASMRKGAKRIIEESQKYKEYGSVKRL